MKLKPIIADPLRLYQLGLRNLMDMAILVHIGRCGIIGARRRSIAEHLAVSYDTARTGTDRLWELGLITSASRAQGPGLPFNLVCTVRGWRLLTDPPDFSPFPHSQLTLAKHACPKKETRPPDKDPATTAPSIHLGAGSDDHHPSDPAGDPVSECAAALGGEAPGHAPVPGEGEAGHAEPAARV